MPTLSHVLSRIMLANYVAGERSECMALLQDFDLLEVKHGAVVDRNACIFCHVGIFRDRAFVIEQVPLLSTH